MKNVGLTGKSLGKVERVFVNRGLDSVSPFDFSLGVNERPGMLPVDASSGNFACYFAEEG